MKNDLTVTLECNNNCSFCPKQELSMIVCKSNDQVYDTIRRIGETGDSIVLSGGEVTIRDDFFRLLDECKNSGISKIGIVTNGRMFAYDKFAKRVLKTGISNVMISLYSTNPQIHDSITNSKGSLEQTIKGIQNVLRYSSNPDILCINLVVSGKNIKELGATIRGLYKLGVRQLLLIDVVTDDVNYFYDYNEFNSILLKILKSKDIGGLRLTLRGFPPCIIEAEHSFKENIIGKNNIIFEPHNVDTLFPLNNSVDDYISNFNSKFSKKLKNCKSCEISDRCLGIQKSRNSFGGDSK